MKVRFIGAGPGDPELLTVKALRFIKQAPIVLYAGSLVAPEILTHAHTNARLINSATLTLEQVVDIFIRAHEHDQDVARVHSGDPSVYGAIAEQMQALKAHGIDFEVIPGVTALSAASAWIQRELTVPDVSQTVIMTRLAAKTPMPSTESLQALAQHRATLAIHLSVSRIHRICEALIPYYGEDCPVWVCYKVGWPDQQALKGTLRDIVAKVRAQKITRTALVLVGEVFGDASVRPSWLYDASKAHIFRPKRKAKH